MNNGAEDELVDNGVWCLVQGCRNGFCSGAFCFCSLIWYWKLFCHFVS